MENPLRSERIPMCFGECKLEISIARCSVYTTYTSLCRYYGARTREVKPAFRLHCPNPFQLLIFHPSLDSGQIHVYWIIFIFSNVFLVNSGYGRGPGFGRRSGPCSRDDYLQPPAHLAEHSRRQRVPISHGYYSRPSPSKLSNILVSFCPPIYFFYPFDHQLPAGFS